LDFCYKFSGVCRMTSDGRNESNMEDDDDDDDDAEYYRQEVGQEPDPGL